MRLPAEIQAIHPTRLYFNSRPRPMKCNGETPVGPEQWREASGAPLWSANHDPAAQRLLSDIFAQRPRKVRRVRSRRSR